MTMTVTEHQITTERKHHPNDGRYPCRPSQEILNAGMKLINILTPDQLLLLKNNDLILDEEETAELYDEIKVGDIIGLGILRGPDYYLRSGFSAHKFEVLEIIKDEDYLVCKNLRSDESEEITFQDISIGFAMGFAEILYRDDKPFGISAEQTITLKIHHDPDKEEENDSTATGSTSESESDEEDKQMEEVNFSAEENRNTKSDNSDASKEPKETPVHTIEEHTLSTAVSFMQH